MKKFLTLLLFMFTAYLVVMVMNDITGLRIEGTAFAKGLYVLTERIIGILIIYILFRKE